jgi:hypothetical protein
MLTFHLRSWVAAQDPEIRHCPVQPDQAQRARQEPDRLPNGHAEEDRHRQAGLDGLIAESRLPTALSAMRRRPNHIGIAPDRQ